MVFQYIVFFVEFNTKYYILNILFILMTFNDFVKERAITRFYCRSVMLIVNSFDSALQVYMVGLLIWVQHFSSVRNKTAAYQDWYKIATLFITNTYLSEHFTFPHVTICVTIEKCYSLVSIVESVTVLFRTLEKCCTHIKDPTR